MRARPAGRQARGEGLSCGLWLPARRCSGRGPQSTARPIRTHLVPPCRPGGESAQRPGSCRRRPAAARARPQRGPQGAAARRFAPRERRRCAGASRRLAGGRAGGREAVTCLSLCARGRHSPGASLQAEAPTIVDLENILRARGCESGDGGRGGSVSNPPNGSGGTDRRRRGPLVRGRGSSSTGVALCTCTTRERERERERKVERERSTDESPRSHPLSRSLPRSPSSRSAWRSAPVAMW